VPTATSSQHPWYMPGMRPQSWLFKLCSFALAFPGGHGAAPVPGPKSAQPMMRSEAATQSQMRAAGRAQQLHSPAPATAVVDSQGAVTRLFATLGTSPGSAPAAAPQAAPNPATILQETPSQAAEPRASGPALNTAILQVKERGPSDLEDMTAEQQQLSKLEDEDENESVEDEEETDPDVDALVEREDSAMKEEDKEADDEKEATVGLEDDAMLQALSEMEKDATELETELKEEPEALPELEESTDEETTVLQDSDGKSSNQVGAGDNVGATSSNPVQSPLPGGEEPTELAEESEEQFTDEIAEGSDTQEETAADLAEENTGGEETSAESAEENITDEENSAFMTEYELEAYTDNVCGHEGGNCSCDGVAFFGTPDGDGVRVDGSIQCSESTMGGGKRAPKGPTPCLCYTLKWCTDNNEFKQQMDSAHRRRNILDPQGINFHQRRRWCGWGSRTCIWGSWERWGNCDVLHGTGHKFRTRKQEMAAANGGECSGSTKEAVQCYMPTRRRYR